MEKNGGPCGKAVISSLKSGLSEYVGERNWADCEVSEVSVNPIVPLGLPKCFN